MAGTSPGDVLTLLQCLSTPKKAQLGHSETFSLDSILDHNLKAAFELLGDAKNKKCTEHLCQYLENGSACGAGSVSRLEKLLGDQCSDDLRWKYALLAVNLMKVLNESQVVAMERYNVLVQDMHNARPAETSAPPMSPDTMSFEQQKVFLTCLQFVVCLGVLPGLNPGVGIPLERRTEFSKLLQKGEKGRAVSAEELEWRLFYCLKSLLGLLDQPSLATLILSRNFGDILAGLLQLCCAPSTRKKARSPAKVQKKSKNQRQIKESDIEYCENEIKKLLDKIYPPLIVRELLVLQGGPGPAVSKCGSLTLERAPAWLRRVCGRLLSDILMKPKGVQYVLKGLLHSAADGGATGAADDWKRCDSVSKVIAHCPRQSVSVEEYYKAIGPQVLELLRCGDRKVAGQYVRVALCALSAMLQEQIALTLKYVLQPLLEPLIRCTDWSDEQLPSQLQLVVGEKQLEQCVDDVHKVFACNVQAQGLLISALHRCLHVLFKLYCFTCSGVTHYRNKVEEIVLVYLRQAEVSTALECVKVFVFEELAESSTQNGLRCPLMPHNVCFVAGPTGGVIAVRTANAESGKWEQRCNAAVELLSKLQKDGLSADFFIYLLQQLTVILTDELESPRRGSRTKSSTNRLEGDTTEATLTRNLILLSLLASMCEKLGHTCFKSTKHILLFVKATLERGVKVLENTADAELGIFESETVTMAMGLLTAVMGGASEVSSEDRERMHKLLPLLEKLSREHPDGTVTEMATDLRIAIATHGFVLSHVLSRASAEMKQRFDETMSKAESVMQDNVTRHRANLDKILERARSGVYTRATKPDDPDVKPKKVDNMPRNNISNPLLEPPVVKKSVIDILAEGIDDLDTHDRETVENILGDSSTSKNSNSTSKKSLIEVIASSDDTEGIADDIDCFCGTGESKGRADQVLSDNAYRGDDYKPGKTAPQSTSALDEAFKELLDPLVPVRGHALISLRRLLESKHPEVIQKQDVLLKIFRENLDHNDTYIYLSAVQGLSVLADMLPQKVVPVLAQEYANFDQHSGKIKRSSELRLKLGEVLMKTTRKLGDTLPAYRDVILRSVLRGARDADHFVRASAVSNLAEMCKLLRFSLGNVLFELFECVSSLIKTDPEPEVRQAAAMFVTLLLQGLGSDSFKVLDSCLRDLYRLLKLTLKVEKHDGVKAHVLLALQELDAILRAFLFPPQTLSKRIGVLETPDVDVGFK